MNLLKYYGKNIHPSCQYCLYGVESPEGTGEIGCEKGRNPGENNPCVSFRYEPTLREPRQQPLLAEFSPEDFKI